MLVNKNKLKVTNVVFNDKEKGTYKFIERTQAILFWVEVSRPFKRAGVTWYIPPYYYCLAVNQLIITEKCYVHTQCHRLRQILG